MAELTIDGVCLPHIWEVELLAEVFLPETRVVAGLQAALANAGLRRLVCEGVDGERLAALRSALEPGGIEVSTTGPPAPPPTYPSVLASPWRMSLRTRALNWTLDAVGAPKRVRGDVYLLPYWHLAPVFQRGSAGWFALRPRSSIASGRRTRRARARRGARRLGRAPGVPCSPTSSASRSVVHFRGIAAQGSNALGLLFDSRALEVIKHRAAESLAVASTLRRAFATRKVKLAVLPFDSPADARLVVHAAREAEIPTLVVQHGFRERKPRSGHDPRRCRRRVGRDRRRTTSASTVRRHRGHRQPRRRERRLVGAERARSRGRTIVLVEYASRLSTRIDSRVSVRHVDTALRALAKERPGTEVVIRPHPAEHEPEIFDASRRPPPGASRVTVDSTSSIADLIEDGRPVHRCCFYGDPSGRSCGCACSLSERHGSTGALAVRRLDGGPRRVERGRSCCACPSSAVVRRCARQGCDARSARREEAMRSTASSTSSGRSRAMASRNRAP